MSVTTILAAVGDKSAGKPAPNRPDDVRKVQALLGKVFGNLAPVMADGVCDAATKKAIADFQSAWGGNPDSTVDPGGQTLRRLVRLAQPLDLRPIKPGRVLDLQSKGRILSNGGGYDISVRTSDLGPLPPKGSGYTLHLLLVNGLASIEVTGQPLNDLMSKDNLGDLLTAIERTGLWSVPIPWQVQLRYKGQVISTSAPQIALTPVQPHNGKMVPLDEKGNGPKLTYQGSVADHEFHGRMFAQVPGYDKFVFIYGGVLEVDSRYRGFDCVTYAGTACAASNMHMAEAGDLAQSLGATACSVDVKGKDPKSGKEVTTKVVLDKSDPAHVKAFFAQPSTSTGSYLLWSTGHVVLVVDGEVHEFKASEPSGYARTAVGDWLAPYKTMKLTVRQLPSRPARAA